MKRRLLKSMVRWWPITRLQQAAFAEAVRQALVNDFEIDAAIRISASVSSGWRWRHIVREMHENVRAGYPLSASLELTHARVDAGLFAALQVGEEQNCLIGELLAFSQRTCAEPAAAVVQIVGRRPEASLFAASLARLLQNHHLTLDLVEASGRLAAAGNRRFARAIREIRNEMDTGEGLHLALRRQRRYFDPFFCDLLNTADSRETLRLRLLTLSSGANVSAK